MHPEEVRRYSLALYLSPRSLKMRPVEPLSGRPQEVSPGSVNT